MSLDDEALNNSLVSLQNVLLDDQDVVIDYDRQSADTNFSDDKSLLDITIGSASDGEDIYPSCQTPESEKFNCEEHLKVTKNLILTSSVISCEITLYIIIINL